MSSSSSFSFSASLLLSAVLAVLQVVLTMVPGAYYGRNGTVDTTTRRSLSRISWGLLLPAMAWYNIVTEISASTIASVWPFAANAVLGNVLGIMVGWGGALVSRTPRHLRSHMAAAAGFGNLNSLPLLIVQAVCNQDSMPFYEEMGSQCSSVGFGYVALGSAAMQILMFPVAAWLLSTPQEPFVTPAASVLPEWLSQRLSKRHLSLRPSRLSQRTMPLTPLHSSHVAGGISLAAIPEAAAEGSTGGKAEDASSSPKAAESASGSEGTSEGPQAGGSGELQVVVASLSGKLPPGEPLHGATSSAAAASDIADQHQQLSSMAPPPLPHDQPADPVPMASVARERLWMAWSFFKQYYLQAACIVPAVAIAVACITPLKNLFVPDTSAPLGFVMGAIYSIEISLLFVTSFILGAVLCRGPGPGGKELGWRPCFAITLLRMGIMPIFGAVVVIGSNKLGLWSPLNPVFTFVLLLQWAVPTANQMQNLASMHNNHEQAMGTLIFWQYVAALVALPGWMTLYLYLMGKYDLM